MSRRPFRRDFWHNTNGTAGCTRIRVLTLIFGLPANGRNHDQPPPHGDVKVGKSCWGEREVRSGGGAGGDLRRINKSGDHRVRRKIVLATEARLVGGQTWPPGAAGVGDSAAPSIKPGDVSGSGASSLA